MPDNKKIINISVGSSSEDLHTIETKIDKLMDIDEPEPVTAPVAADGTAPTDPADDVAKLTADWKASGISGDPPKDPEFVATSKALGVDRDVVDKALAEMDAEKEPPKPKSGGFKAKIGRFFSGWWHNKRARYGSIAGLVVLLLVLAILPPTQAFGLNLIGVRGTASLTVLDATNQLPLKNATVSLGAVSGKTDAKGHVSLQQVKLGSQPLTVRKVAFAPVTKQVSAKMGTTDLGSVSLKAVGAQYKFTVTDYLSGKPVTTAQAASGQATALADKQGHIVLTATDPGTDTLSVNVTATGYRTATVAVALGNPNVTTVPLVSNLKSVYISKQTGKYDVYKTDLDGKNKKLLLAATGNETSNNTLVPDGTGEVVAVVNNRDNTKDSNGYTLQTLTLINIATGAPTVADHSERIQPIDWIDSRLIYVAIKAGASAANPSRYLLMSYDYKTNQRLQLDHANAFNDVVSAGGAIYYATSNGYNGGVSQFTKISPDGTGKQALLVSEVWNVFRLNYTDLRLATGDTNYSYTIGTAKPATTKDSYNNQNRLYIDSPDGKHSLWVDNRDGKGTLVSYDTTSKKETVLAQLTGLKYPVHWLGNDIAVYRLQSAKETADYAVNITGGTAQKITDVTDATGLALWYYY